MICIKLDIPKELGNKNDKLKTISHSKDTVFFLFLKIENKKLFIKSINLK